MTILDTLSWTRTGGRQSTYSPLLSSSACDCKNYRRLHASDPSWLLFFALQPLVARTSLIVEQLVWGVRVYALKVTSLLIHTYFFFKASLQGWLSQCCMTSAGDIPAMNLEAIPSQNQHRPCYSSLSHTSNFNLRTVLAYRKHVTPSVSCMHFTSSKRMTNSPFSQGLQFCTIHISSGSSFTGISHNTLHVHMFEQT